jgi:hypothetical protein
MSDDPLSRATRALREETRGDDASARFTRSRIMASAHEQRVKRRTRLAFLLPIAASFVAATAWGAANGKISRAFEAVSEAFRVAPQEAPPESTPKATPPRRSAEAPVASVAPPVPAVPPSSPPLAEPAPTPPPVAVARVQAAERAPINAAPGDAGGSRDPALELYRAAHRAHFVERDATRALPAWDAYLKAAPNGALVLEARYNRALCLVRLHRSSEARAALTPFAAGRFGGYRKREAAELLEALPPELAGPGE